ncbi:MAG: hypothetical protein CGU28_11090 [Candidatus Dactylopiibacterium carminicum]|nr:MAG: hypothetical protein CGU28_11090 [Candidatus Dactylopiibacterium carminicum]
MKLLALLTLALLAGLVQAELYKWVDAEGHVHYSDTPPINGKAQPVRDGVSVVPALPPQTAPDATLATPSQASAISRPAVTTGTSATERQRLIERCEQNRGTDCVLEADNILRGGAGTVYVPVPVLVQPPRPPRPPASSSSASSSRRAWSAVRPEERQPSR